MCNKVINRDFARKTALRGYVGEPEGQGRFSEDFTRYRKYGIRPI